MRLFLEPVLAGTPVLAELARPVALRAIANTVFAGAASACLAVALGTAAALAVTITDMRGKRLFVFLFAMSMLVAPQVIALAFKALAGPASPLLNALGLAPPAGARNPMLGLGGIVTVLGLHHAPLALLVLLSGLRRLPRDLVEAAQIDGARPGQIVRLVLLPVLRRQLAAAWLLTFIAAAGNFGIPALLGLPANVLTVPTLIYRRMSSFGPDAIGEAAALSLVLAGLAAIAIPLAGLFAGRHGVTLEAGQRLTPFWRLGRARPLVEAWAWLLLGIALLLPSLSLLVNALLPALGVPLRPGNLGLAAFAEVLLRQQATRGAMVNSFLYAGLAAGLIGACALPVAFVLARANARRAALLRLTMDMPYVLPGIVLAIALILIFLRPLPLLGFSLYGTGAIIVIAYVARFLALGVKPVEAALAVCDPAIEEAAALDGAGVWRRFRCILLPATLPAVTAGMLLVFLTAFNELTVSALLWSADSRTLGVVLFSLDEAGLANEAAALGIATMAVVLALMLVLERLKPVLPEGALPWDVDTAVR